MKRGQQLLIGAFLAILLWGPIVFGLDPMGPPAGRLKKGQFSTGGDYSFSNMDLKADGVSTLKWRNLSTGEVEIPDSFPPAVQKRGFTIHGLESQKVYANLGYGIINGCDIFLRLGSANTEWHSISEKNFAIGFGNRMTFYEDSKWKFGALVQFSWLRSEFDSEFLRIPAHQAWWKWTGDFSIMEAQIAVGPTYKLNENVSIYGGPFLHYIDGELDVKSDEEPIETLPYPGAPAFNAFYEDSYDIDEASSFGGYIGVEVDFAENISYNVEYQHTAAADALGMSLLFRF